MDDEHDCWSLDEGENEINSVRDRDYGVSGYGENPLTGEIDGCSRSEGVEKKSIIRANVVGRDVFFS